MVADHRQGIIEVIQVALRRVPMRTVAWAGLFVAVMVLITVGAHLYMGARVQAQVDELTTRLGDESRDVRAEAAQALRDVGEPAIATLCECLRSHDDEAVRELAARVLSSIGAQAVPALTDRLSSPDELVRMQAAWALGEIGPAAADAAPELARLLRDDSSEVREAVSVALSRIGEQKGLMGLLKSE